VCHPKSDHLIVEMLEAGRIRVDGSGLGTVYIRDERTGIYAPIAEQVQQAGKRPRAAEYRRCVVRWRGVCRTLRINRVVYVALHGPTPCEIDHVNENTLDCGAANLQGLTRFENEAKKREAAWWQRCHGPEEVMSDASPF